MTSNYTNSGWAHRDRHNEDTAQTGYQRCIFPSDAAAATAAPTKEYEWSIGIEGTSPFSFGPSQEVDNPVLTRNAVSDVPAAIVADPFMLRRDHTWYMFFEVMNRQTRKGEIGLASSENGMKWTYQQIVLAEPFHSSYPYVFYWAGDYYIIPESYKASSISIVQGIEFPYTVVICNNSNQWKGIFRLFHLFL